MTRDEAGALLTALRAVPHIGWGAYTGDEPIVLDNFDEEESGDTWGVAWFPCYTDMTLARWTLARWEGDGYAFCEVAP